MFGKMLKSYRVAGGAILAAIVLAGCTPAPSPSLSEADMQAAVAACSGDTPCAVASLVARELNKIAGKDYGNGVRLRGAKSAGDTLIMGVDIPARAPLVPARNYKGPKAQIKEVVSNAFCRNPQNKNFVRMGLKLRVQTYLPSGKVFTDQTITSCR